MNEEQAINELVAHLGANGNENPNNNAPQTQEQKEQTQEGVTPSEATPAFTKDDLTNSFLSAMKQFQSESAASEKPAPSETDLQKEQLLSQLGLNGITEKLNAIETQMATEQEARRRQDVFNQNINQFEKDFPTIKPEAFHKFASENGFLNLLGEDYAGWKAVAKAMINVSQPTQTPDPIVGSNGVSNEVNAFDRIKKGEDVSDIEIGADLLKLAGV